MHMDDLMVGVVVGYVLRGVVSRGGGRGVDVAQAINGWFNRRRYTKLRLKAERRGFLEQFDREWRYYEHTPFGLQLAVDSTRAYRRAERAHLEAGKNT